MFIVINCVVSQTYTSVKSCPSNSVMSGFLFFLFTAGDDEAFLSLLNMSHTHTHTYKSKTACTLPHYRISDTLTYGTIKPTKWTHTEFINTPPHTHAHTHTLYEGQSPKSVLDQKPEMVTFCPTPLPHAQCSLLLAFKVWDLDKSNAQDHLADLNNTHTRLEELNLSMHKTNDIPLLNIFNSANFLAC